VSESAYRASSEGADDGAPPGPVVQLVSLLNDPIFPIRKLLRESDIFMMTRTCKYAAKELQHTPVTKSNAVHVASGSGRGGPHAHMLLWCLRNRAIIRNNDEFWRAIARSTTMELVDDFLSEGHEDSATWLAWFVALVADEGHAELVRKIVRRRQSDSDLAFLAQDAIASAGLLDVAKEVDGAHVSWLPCLPQALMGGHTAFVQWMLQDADASPARRQSNVELVECAASSGNVELVSWLVGRAWGVSELAVRNAAQHGRTELLRWFMERGFSPGEECMLLAVTHGHVDTTAWLFETGMQLTDDLLYTAATASTPEMVQWLLEHDCPYESDTLCSHALWPTDGDKGVFRTLVDLGVLNDLERLVHYSDHQVDTTFLHKEYGIALSHDHMPNAVQAHSIERVRYGLANQAPVHSEVFYRAIEQKECAILIELLSKASTEGQIAHETRLNIDRALHQLAPDTTLISSIINILHSYGYNLDK